MKKEYIVCLAEGIDYDEFWNEMETTTTGHPFVPEHRVDIVNNRDLSLRSCHYSLTDDEAKQLRNDPRVVAVALPAPIDLRASSAIQYGNFTRVVGGNDPSWVNWGLRRCAIESLESTIGNQFPYCIDGTGVDIVVQDNGVMSGHPEFEDEHGETRLIEHDWYEAAGIAGTMPIGHYGDVGNHGTHVAGVAAGKTYGWAKGAKIYSIQYNAFATASDAFDLIKAWHLRKPVDPKTGFKRPTIVNQSWGYRWYYNNGVFGGNRTAIFYRGVDRGTALNTSWGNVYFAHNFTYTPADVDQQELEAAGVICVRASGNYSHKIDTATGPDWNNYYTFNVDWAGGIVNSGDPIYYHRGGSPWSANTILVADVDSLSYDSSLDQVTASSERGPGVDISAPGMWITSSTNSEGFGGGQDSSYPGNDAYKISRISGTSMSAPQVTGVLALFLQLNPGASIADCKKWLINFGSKANQLYSTGSTTDYAVSNSLLGQANRMLYNPYAKDIGFEQRGNGLENR